MGVSASASVIVGFQVEYSDFYTVSTVIDDFPSCLNGHRQDDSTSLYCSQCGKIFKKQLREIVTANEGFSNFCELAKITPHNVITKVKGDWKCLEECSNFPGELSFHQINNVEPHNRGDVVVALGIQFLEQRSIMDGGNWGKPNIPNGTPLVEIVNKFAPWSSIANQIWPGEYRQPSLWLATSCG